MIFENKEDQKFYDNRKARSKRYSENHYSKNKEKVLNRSREYYKQNRERLSIEQKKRYVAKIGHPVRVAKELTPEERTKANTEYRREYAKTHKHTINAINKKWRDKNKEYNKKYVKKNKEKIRKQTKERYEKAKLKKLNSNIHENKIIQD